MNQANVEQKLKVCSFQCGLELAEAVKQWWNQHKNDTTGDYGERNVFDSEPEFVAKAKDILGDWEAQETCDMATML